MKSGFLDKLIKKVGLLEPAKVQKILLQLVDEKGFFEKVFDALQEGVIVIGANGDISYLNRASCDLFGLDPATAPGSKISERIKGLDWKSLLSAGRVVRRDLEVFYPENRYLNFYLAPIETDELPDEMMGYVMIAHDITQSKRHEEEKMESERFSALTMLAAGVAHEIGNPLNSLNIHLQLLERKLRTANPEAYENEWREMVETSKGEIKRLDFIVDQFLGAIRPTRPQLALTDLNQVMRESIDFLGPEIRDRGISVKLELHKGLPLLEVDSNQMKQAFYNLIRNANQAMGKSGSLIIRSDVDDEEVVISFDDTGKGISAEDMGSIFQPYFTTKKNGSGLGLLIVRRIVREHGGEIEIDSQKNVGTTVTIHLPLKHKSIRLLPESESDNVIEI